MAGAQVTLQIGERRFITTPNTLTQESEFFASLLSGRWDNIQPDGSYLIDADGQIFEHILRYLRRGVLPVFYDRTKGHDHALYLALLEEAKYFQIPRLERWIRNEEYLKAIKITHSAIEAEGTDSVLTTTQSDVEFEYHPFWTTKTVRKCPRGISSHYGNASVCRRQCIRSPFEAPDEYQDKEFLKILIIRKQLTFDQQFCVESR